METGTRLGPYEILGPLGAGGMGEVYLARDPKLDREVAIKVLPAAVAGDPERLGRLEREARVLAALDHPNVAAVYGLDESGGVTFLVMQLAAGETLADRLAPGPLPLDDALEIARQIAEGLEAAHERGIVHRDLKPANIMVAPGGEVKILDFGLAKALGSESAANSQPSELSASPTMLAVTSAGMILGTAAYMSPEQARGRPLDRRTDIWSFGCVLYEMLTGTKSFTGETVTDLLAAVITREPDWDRVPAEMPASIDRMLRRCFDKDPHQRVQDIGELRIVLAARDGGEVASVRGGHAQTRSVRDRLGWPAAAVMAALAATLGWQIWHAPDAGETPAYVALHEPGIRLPSNVEAIQVAVSPDGRSVAIAGQDEDGRGIWIRNLAEPRARRLEGTVGSDLAWSPDGQQVASVDGNDLRLHDLRTGANSVRYRGEGRVSSPLWTADGRLIFSVILGREFRVLESLSSGQNATLLSVVSGSSGSGLRSYPLGEGRFLVSRWSAAHGHVDTAVFRPSGQADEPLLHLGAAAAWAPPDLLLFARDGALWAQRFDAEAAQLRGEPVALLTEIDTAPIATPWLSVGGDTLSYRTGLGYESPAVLEWVDREGRLTDRAGEPANYFDPRIAPDGRNIVFDLSNEGDAGDIWLGAGDGPGIRLTSSLADETRPVWSPDGSRVVLETTREGQPGRLYLKNASDPAGELRSLGADPAVEQPTDWAGDTIVGNDEALTTIWIVDATTGESRPFRETNFADYGGALAPDASHIAYVSNETGRDEIWVDTFPSPGTPRRVSPQGGTTPVWRRDGNEIVYLDPDGFLTSVAVTSMSPLTLGQPEPLFQVALRVHDIRQFDVSPDGQRFLLNRVIENPDLPIRLLLGWREELARRAGPDW